MRRLLIIAVAIAGLTLAGLLAYRRTNRQL
ncbi:hypothetical protein BJ970_005080 [Saccharopolyspora phatthalungensis]|uniref:Uncharacterized protein n=1 Tax=Saccharopolyspora phatthalungensis TaxID=664693 RepID=A0A840QAV4_9PSEU|nr:hypothetical protein [Saccharopolyspora phatthalungensis]